MYKQLNKAYGVHLLPRIKSFSTGPVCKKIRIKRWREFWGCGLWKKDGGGTFFVAVGLWDWWGLV